MSYNIGIDLGTTFSVVAVKGNVILSSNYRPGRYLPYCDVTIIPTPDGDPTFPSVFWADPEDPSKVLVGTDTKRKAEEGDAPIMFSKRYIGTNHPLKLHGREYSARQVATEILKYLKMCAERALDTRISRAVVTHPAYFDLSQVQETRDAAIAAGFDMSLPQQLMMEPAAAALSFTFGIEKDPLRVLVYDLGGGTFDVTVLEKNQSLITQKAFDGDHLLGGYNFDRALVEWALQRQRDKGRVIPYDESNPDHRGRRARLLQLAESVKEELSRQRSGKISVDFRAQDIVYDADGKKVQILEKINREQYAELNKDELDKTIQCCHKALAKAGMTIEDIDYLLLVGGSTYGQWVVDTVKKAFGPERMSIDHEYDKDLCVGAGAALCAAALPPVVGGADGSTLMLDISDTSSLLRVNIPGNVRLAENSPIKPESLQVKLTLLPDGAVLTQSVKADGGFLFESVELREDDPTEFEVEVLDSTNRPLLDKKKFDIRYAPDNSGGTQIYTVLPKPIYLNSADGVKKIAEDGVTLPARRVITASKIQEEADIDIDVYQEDIKIYTIKAGDVAKDAPRGSKVIITVEITQKNEMTGTVTVQSAAGAALGQKAIHFSFPPIRLPDLAELKAEFNELDDKRQELAALSPDGEHRALLAGKGAKLARKLAKKFEEMEPDRQEIVAALKEFKLLVYPPPDDMSPPKARFVGLVEECQAILATKSDDPTTPSYQQLLAKLEAQGNEAAQSKNQKKWTTVNDSLENLYSRINKKADQKFEEPELPPSSVLKQQGIQEIEQLRVACQRKREACQSDPAFPTIGQRLERVDKRLDVMIATIEKIGDDSNPKQALAKIRSVLAPRPQIEKDIATANQTIKIDTVQ